jgi:endonuclease III
MVHPRRGTPRRPAIRRRHESLVKARARLTLILDRLHDDYAGLGTALSFASPFQLLVATILSAQSTDGRVNMVTPALFARYPDPESFAQANPEDVEKLVYSTGFFRNKTKNILGAARTLLEKFDGVVPQTMAELITLPGVSRKTANVVLSHAFGKAEGVAVDTHVFRLSKRLDLSRAPTPEGVERDLMQLAPRERWTEIADTFIWHGRRICRARAPRCLDCQVLDLCPTGRRLVGSNR